MSNSFSRRNSISDDSRHPLTAALLSILPGLGQLYVGERRKGVLFLDVTIANAVLLWLMLFTEPMIRAIRQMGQTFHFRPNDMFMDAVGHAHVGSPASLLVLCMMAGFVCYAARDAYDEAFGQRRKKLYPDVAVEFSEATSGSYILHIAMILTFGLMALFFVMPKQKVDLVSIQFIDLDKVDKTKVPPKTRIISTANNDGKNSNRKPDAASSANQAASASRLQASSPAARSSASARTASASPVKPAASVRSPVRSELPSVQPVLKPVPSQAASLSAPSPIVPNSHHLQGSSSIAASAPLPVLLAPSNTQAPVVPAIRVQSDAVAQSFVQTMASHRSGLVRLTAPPVPLPLAAGHSTIVASLPTPGAARTSGSEKFEAHLPSGGSLPSSAFAGTQAPAPVGVSTAGTVGGSSGGAPKLSKVGNFSTNTGQGDNGEHSPAPRRVGPAGNGNEAISVLPSVGAGHQPGIGKGKEDGGDNPVHGDGGPISKEIDYSAYMADLQRRIKRHWFPPTHSESKKVVVTFTVSPAGDLSDLKIVRSSGLQLADQCAFRAVQSAAPLSHLPEGAHEPVQIEFTFDYNVFTGGGGGSWRQL